MSVNFNAPSGYSSSSSSRPTRPLNTRRTLRNTESSAYSSVQLQPVNNNHYPHLAGSPDCLCSACHLKMSVFPRSQDGKIVLPPPWLPQRSGDSTSVPQAAPRGTNDGRSHAPTSRTSSRERIPAFKERQPEGAIPRHVQAEVDRGEGTSRSLRRLSGPGMSPNEEEPQRLPPMERNFELTDKPESRTPRPSTLEKQSTRFDRSKPPRRTKPYDTRPELQELQAPWPRPSGIQQPEQGNRTGRDTSNYSASFTSHPTPNPPSNPRREAWPDPFENMESEPFPQLFDLPSHLHHRTSNVSASGSSATISQTLTLPHHLPSDIGYRRGIPHREGQNIMRPPSSFSSPNESLLPPSRHMIPSQPQPSTPIEGFHMHPQVIRFNSRSRNPQPSTAVMRHPTPEIGDPVEASPLGQLSQQHQQSTSVLSIRDLEETRSRIRFQEPVVVPDDHEANPIQPRELTVMQVKWDSDRKRRQGYFSQDDGTEKSNFRHYNKSQIDFGN